MVLPQKFETATSGFPSPFRSATATDRGRKARRGSFELLWQHHQLPARQSGRAAEQQQSPRYNSTCYHPFSYSESFVASERQKGAGNDLGHNHRYWLGSERK